MSTLPPFLLLAATLLGACHSTPESGQNTPPAASAATGASVPFTEARNYFVSNTYPDQALHSVTITSQAEFDKIFGMATTMGPDGRPTPIDFSRQHVLAVIAPASDKEPRLEAGTLQQSDRGLTLTYRLTEGPAGPTETRPALLLLVDNQYSGDVQLQPL